MLNLSSLNQRVNALTSKINSIPNPPPVATTANNLAGGIASQIPYQTGANTTAFIPNGTSGQVLKSNGTSAPSWITPTTSSTLDGVLANGNTATGATAKITLTDTDAKITIVNSSVGGIANPLLLLQNNNTTAGGTTFETYKNDTPTSTGGDPIGIWSATCNTNVGKTEIARITQLAYGVGASNNDGGIVLACKVNSSLAPTNFLACNGGAGAGEVQIFRPITNPTGSIELNATASSGTGDILLTPKTTGYVRVSEDILTNNKIGTELGFPTNVGSYVDFAGGNPDDYFRQDINGIEYRFNDTTNVGTTTLLNKYSTSEQYFKQELITPTNTLTTIMENDLTHHRIKLEETLSGANTEITKDEIDIDDGSGSVAKLTPTDIQFDIGSGFVSIRPKYFSSSGGSVAVSNSPPLSSIYNLGAITGMATGQKWKIEIGFTSDLYASDGIFSYRVLNSVGNDVALNTACSASVGGTSAFPYPKPTEVVIPSSNTGSFISINDNFEVGFGTAPFTIDFTGGTYNGFTWNIGNYKLTITLTYIEG
jgi:hypothetical protein